MDSCGFDSCQGRQLKNCEAQLRHGEIVKEFFESMTRETIHEFYAPVYLKTGLQMNVLFDINLIVNAELDDPLAQGTRASSS
jgi:hypothetical protein